MTRDLLPGVLPVDPLLQIRPMGEAMPYRLPGEQMPLRPQGEMSRLPPESLAAPAPPRPFAEAAELAQAETTAAEAVTAARSGASTIAKVMGTLGRVAGALGLAFAVFEEAKAAPEKTGDVLKAMQGINPMASPEERATAERELKEKREGENEQSIQQRRGMLNLLFRALTGATYDENGLPMATPDYKKQEPFQRGEDGKLQPFNSPVERVPSSNQPAPQNAPLPVTVTGSAEIRQQIEVRVSGLDIIKGELTRTLNNETTVPLGTSTGGLQGVPYTPLRAPPAPRAPSATG